MAKNGKGGDVHQNGAVKVETQVHNPITGNYVKRDPFSGKFIDVKSDGKAFKGITTEANITNIGFSIPKTVANKAEKSVIRTLNKKLK